MEKPIEEMTREELTEEIVRLSAQVRVLKNRIPELPKHWSAAAYQATRVLAADTRVQLVESATREELKQIALGAIVRDAAIQDLLDQLHWMAGSRDSLALRSLASRLEALITGKHISVVLHERLYRGKRTVDIAQLTELPEESHP